LVPRSPIQLPKMTKIQDAFSIVFREIYWA
jgi:hypothetical protein